MDISTTTYTSEEFGSALFGFFLGASLITMFIFAFVGLIVCILGIIALWKIFKKAGKPGWAAIVPIYNGIVLLEVVGLSPWWIVAMICASVFGGLADQGSIYSVLATICAVINLVLYIMTCGRLAKSFGKSAGFAVGLFFFNVIFMMILAFGKSEYKAIDKNEPKVMAG